MKLDLLTNATVVDDAIRFVSQQSKENPLLAAIKMRRNRVNLTMTMTKIS
jgi:hypothetical protein